MSLLSKTRKINALLQKAAGKSVNFKEMSETLSETIDTNIFIISLQGKVLGFAFKEQIENERLQQYLADSQFPEEYTKGLSNIRETLLNLDVISEHTAFPVEDRSLFKDGLTTIVPIIGGGERLGTLSWQDSKNRFVMMISVLAEYGSTVVGMEYSFMKKQKKWQRKHVVKL